MSLTVEERLRVEFTADDLTTEHVEEAIRILKVLGSSAKVLTKRQILSGTDPIHACTTGRDCIDYLSSKERMLGNGFCLHH